MGKDDFAEVDLKLCVLQESIEMLQLLAWCKCNKPKVNKGINVTGFFGRVRLDRGSGLPEIF